MNLGGARQRNGTQYRRHFLVDNCAFHGEPGDMGHGARPRDSLQFFMGGASSQVRNPEGPVRTGHCHPNDLDLSPPWPALSPAVRLFWSEKHAMVRLSPSWVPLGVPHL